MTAPIVTPRRGEDAAPGPREDAAPAPRAAIHALADGLTGHGFDVGGPASDESQQLVITNVRGALCTLNLSEDGHLTWEYRPCHGTHTDPAHLAGMVLRLLGAPARLAAQAPPDRYPGLTLKGTVGRMLADRGMTVRLAIIQHDTVSYDVYAEIEVTNPAQPGRGRVRVTDHATVCWHFPCHAGPAAAPHPGDIARIIAGALAGQCA